MGLLYSCIADPLYLFFLSIALVQLPLCPYGMRAYVRD